MSWSGALESDIGRFEEIRRLTRGASPVTSEDKCGFRIVFVQVFRVLEFKTFRFRVWDVSGLFLFRCLGFGSLGGLGLGFRTQVFRVKGFRV